MTDGSTSAVGRVLFIGLGVMGAPMARNVVAAGHPTAVYDVDPDLTARIAEEIGAQPVRDLGAAASEADTVILMLPNSTIVTSVLAGEDGLLHRLHRGTLVVDMGSSQPASTAELARAAAEFGIEMADAPVSGGAARAATAELSIMFGGSEAALARATPLLRSMGSSIVRTGDVGAGHAMKALNNLLSAIGLIGASEVLSIGRRFGLDPHVMIEVLNSSTGGNHATRVKFDKHILSRAFDSGFALQLMIKDVRTALDLAADLEATAPVSAAAVQTAVGAQRMLADARADHTEVARYVERNAGTELR